MKPAIHKLTARTAAILLVFAVVGTALLAFTFNMTRGIVARNEEQAKLALIGQVLPPDLYDNDLLHDTLTLPPSAQLGTDEASLAYRARLRGQPSALVMEANAPDGYGGDIKLLVAIRSNGEIAGVRVLADHETPGLGDYIEIAKSDWIRIFDGASLRRYAPQDWRVKKDGGKFDYVTGATISPRAIVKAVHNALEYFGQHRAMLLGPPQPPADRTGKAQGEQSP